MMPPNRPTAPFRLAPWLTVTDPERFYAALRRDVIAGPGCPGFAPAREQLELLRAHCGLKGES